MCDVDVDRLPWPDKKTGLPSKELVGLIIFTVASDREKLGGIWSWNAIRMTAD
jgi:hypothetical protein